MKFTVKAGMKLPEFGSYPAKVSHIAETTSNTENKGAQLEVTFESMDPSNPWSIRKWYNLTGFRTEEVDGENVIVRNKKTGLPELDPAKTEAAMNILGVDAQRITGIAAGKDIDAEDLVGSVCAIGIEPNQNNKPSVEKVYSTEYFAKLQVQEA